MDLSKHLLPSYSVELGITTLDQGEEPTILSLKTMIDSGYVDGSFKILAPMYRNRTYLLQKNEILSVNFYVTENLVKNVYQISCKVIEKQNINNHQIVSLKVLSEPLKNQRRQAFRINIYNEYSIIVNDETADVVTKDMSFTGMGMLSPIQLNAEDTFTVTIDTNTKETDESGLTNHHERMFTVNCRVVDAYYQSEINKYMIHVQFLDLTNQQSKWLIQYLYAKESEVIKHDSNLSDHRDKLEHGDTPEGYKRLGDDKIIKRYQAIGLINIVIIFFAVIFFLYAQPAKLYALDNFFNIKRARVWQPNYFIASLVTVFISICFSNYGLILNALRIKRETDRFSKTLIVSLLLGIVLFFVLIYYLATQSIFNVIS